MLLLDKTKPALDPRIVGFVVILLGITAMFMNKAMTAHIICAVAAVYLLAAKAYKPFAVYLTIYIAVALLMANVDKIHNTSAMLLIVSLSYFVQKLVVLLMMGSFFVHMTTIPLCAVRHAAHESTECCCHSDYGGAAFLPHHKGGLSQPKRQSEDSQSIHITATICHSPHANDGISVRSNLNEKHPHIR